MWGWSNYDEEEEEEEEYLPNSTYVDVPTYIDNAVS